MPTSIGIRRGAVIAIACLAVALTSGSAQLDVPEEPQLAVVDDGRLPLPGEGDVLVADLDGIAHATALAEAIGTGATVLDLGPLTDLTADVDEGAVEQLVTRVRAADVVIVTDRERPETETPVDGETLAVDEIAAPGAAENPAGEATLAKEEDTTAGAQRSCRSLVATWLVGLGAPTVVITDVLPTAGSEDAVGEAGALAATEPGATDEPASDPPQEAQASFVYLLDATVEDATLAALLTGAVRASGDVLAVGDEVGETPAEIADCPELPEPPDAVEPSPEPGPSDAPRPSPSDAPEPGPSHAPEPSPSDAPEPEPSTSPAPEPSPEPSAPTEREPAPEDRIKPRAPGQHTRWRLPVRELPAASALGLSVDTAGVDLVEALVAEDRIRLTGELTGIAVVDRRGDESHGWTLSAQVSDLVGPGRLTADHLGWTPRVGDERAIAGPQVDSVLSGGPGLGLPAVLGTAARGTSGKPLAVDAELVLETARDARPGAYAGTITLTLFPTE